MSHLVYLAATAERATRAMLGLGADAPLPDGVLPLFLDQPSHDPLTHEAADTGATEVRGQAAFAVFAVVERPLERVRADLLAAVATRRWAVETGGIALANGATIKTDAESQAKLTGAKVFSDLNPDGVIDWKGESGWVQIDRATLTAFAQAVGAHVQACFTRERVLAEQIAAAQTLAELPTPADIAAGWPT